MSHVDIMTTLFDQDTVTRDLIASKERTARIKQEKETKVDNIKSIMSNLKLSIQQALDAMNVPYSERDYYIQKIEGKKES